MDKRIKKFLRYLTLTIFCAAFLIAPLGVIVSTAQSSSGPYWGVNQISAAE